jgi:non-heme chloroperoxidase
MTISLQTCCLLRAIVATSLLAVAAGPSFGQELKYKPIAVKTKVDSDLAKEFHIVTYDLRGHGNSDKPLDPAAYRNSTAWGQEVQAVIAAAGLKRPVLVGWSYAGRVISDYLATEGAGKIAGVNFVDAPIKVDPALIGDNLKNLPLMASEEARHLAAAVAELPYLWRKN